MMGNVNENKDGRVFGDRNKIKGREIEKKKLRENIRKEEVLPN